MASPRQSPKSNRTSSTSSNSSGSISLDSPPGNQQISSFTNPMYKPLASDTSSVSSGSPGSPRGAKTVGGAYASGSPRGAAGGAANYDYMAQQATVTKSSSRKELPYADDDGAARDSTANQARAQRSNDNLGATGNPGATRQRPARAAPALPPAARTQGGVPARSSYYTPRFPPGSGARAKDSFFVADFHQDLPQREIDSYYYPRDNPSKQPKARGTVLFSTEWMSLTVGMHVSMPRHISSVPVNTLSSAAHGNSIRAEAIDIEYLQGGPDFARVWFKAIGSSQIFSVGINDLMSNWLDEGNPTVW